jgi:hypothetical protein
MQRAVLITSANREVDPASARPPKVEKTLGGYRKPLGEASEGRTRRFCGCFGGVRCRVGPFWRVMAVSTSANASGGLRWSRWAARRVRVVAAGSLRGAVGISITPMIARGIWVWHMRTATRPRRTVVVGAGMRGRRGIGLAMARKPKTCVAGVERDLAAMPGDIAASGLALSALELARQMDGDGSPTAKAACGRALARALGELRALCPAETTADAFDEVAAKRAARRKASSE